MAIRRNADPNGVNADLYSKNLKDAGMRLVLPGAAGQSFTYYIRVESNEAETSGQYSLQVRLQEQPEVAGTTSNSPTFATPPRPSTCKGCPTARR